MLTSSITCSENSTPRLQHHLPAFPLMTYNVIRDSHLQTSHSICNSRVIGSLSWIENEQIASLNSRVTFINEITYFISEKIPSRETPLTLVSLGSEGLLMEYFIHQQLKKSGYRDISWRVIDSGYQNNGYANSRNEFTQKVDGKVNVFTTEQAYFNKASDVAGENLASRDKHRGAVIILSINPPAALFPEKLIEHNSICLRGHAVTDINVANSIYLMVASCNAKEFVQKAINQLNLETQIISSEHVIRYAINGDGLCEVNFCQSKISSFIKNGVQTYLNSLSEPEIRREKNLTLNDINLALNKYISTLPAIGLYGTKTFVSDYDNSITQLNNFFINSHNKTLLAALDKNQIYFHEKI